MIGKLTKRTSFDGCVRYVLKEEKARLLEAVGVEGTLEQIAELFELQSLLNDKVKNIVGHTSLSFSPEDSLRLRNDDALMLKIAREYMERMGYPKHTIHHRSSYRPQARTLSYRVQPCGQ